MYAAVKASSRCLRRLLLKTSALVLPATLKSIPFPRKSIPLPRKCTRARARMQPRLWFGAAFYELTAESAAGSTGDTFVRTERGVWSVRKPRFARSGAREGTYHMVL